MRFLYALGWLIYLVLLLFLVERSSNIRDLRRNRKLLTSLAAATSRSEFSV